MKIVEATERDIPAVADFFRTAWAMTGPGAPGWAGADEEVMEDLTRRETLRERIGGPVRRMFLATVDERVVAFAATRWTGRGPAELAGIVVLQEMVGQGIGTPLLRASLDRLAADGAVAVFVRTEADNERALGFSRANGFGDERTVHETVNGNDVVLTELRRRIGPSSTA